MTTGNDKNTVMQKLQEPFAPFDIEWRVQQSGETNGRRWALVLAYIDNRAIMDRLDEVLGIGGWQNEYTPMPDGGIICGLKCKIGDEWITKYDGADKSAIEPTKGGLSNAMKRAAVQWGIGRYLYNLESTFVNLVAKDDKRAEKDYLTALIKVNTTDKFPTKFFYERPQLPVWALPKGGK